MKTPSLSSILKTTFAYGIVGVVAFHFVKETAWPAAKTFYHWFQKADTADLIAAIITVLILYAFLRLCMWAFGTVATDLKGDE